MTNLLMPGDSSFDYHSQMARSICSRCVMDSSVREIRFDGEGVCQFCHTHDLLEAEFPSDPPRRDANLERLAQRIRAAGRGRKYDCVCGVSGGRDSTFLLHTVVKRLGLRPLAVHFDNGWNSEIAVRNIKNACDALQVDLETEVMDWEEFRDLLRSFLRASTPDVDVPTDVGILSVLHRVAAREGIPYILNGHAFRTEGLCPLSWTYMDGRYIEGIQRRFGTRPLRRFPNFKLMHLLYYRLIKGIHVVPLLNYVEYEPEKVESLLGSELGWKAYGGHHHESLYTRFIHGYFLPKKFNVDNRRVELSALVRSGKCRREEALAELEKAGPVVDRALESYVLPKLGISPSEWSEILSAPVRSFLEFPSYFRWIRRCRVFVKWACQLNLLPRLLYLKYLGH